MAEISCYSLFQAEHGVSETKVLQWTEEDYRRYLLPAKTAPACAIPPGQASAPLPPTLLPFHTYAATNTPMVMPAATAGPALQDRSNSMSSQMAANSSTGGGGQPVVKRKPLPAWLSDDKAKAEHMKKKMKTNSLFK